MSQSSERGRRRVMRSIVPWQRLEPSFQILSFSPCESLLQCDAGVRGRDSPVPSTMRLVRDFHSLEELRSTRVGAFS